MTKTKQTAKKPAKPAQIAKPKAPGAGRGGNIPPPDHRWPKGISGNPHGRPRTISALRQYIQSIGEQASGHQDLTRLDVLLRQMYQSKNAGDRANVLKYGWGNVPQPIGGADDLGPIKIQAVEAYSYDAAVAAIAAGPDEDRADAAQDYHGGDGEALG